MTLDTRLQVVDNNAGNALPAVKAGEYDHVLGLTDNPLQNAKLWQLKGVATKYFHCFDKRCLCTSVNDSWEI